VQIELPVAARVQLLLEDYAHFASADPGPLCQALLALKAVRGAEQVAQWQALAQSGAVAQLVEELLVKHYDPIYRRSMSAHFHGFDSAPMLNAADGGPAALAEVARALTN
jgi:tRNA 2-selenouridine synthase